MKLKQLSVYLENRSGSVMELTAALADANINIRAFSIADTTDFGIARMILADDEERALSELVSRGFLAKINKVIAARLDDSPGSFHRVVSAITNAGISIEYSYAFFAPDSTPYAIIRTSDNTPAIEALEAAGIHTLQPEDMEENK